MGTIYYCLCHDCRNYIDLDKFYSFAAYKDDEWGSKGYADIDKEDLESYGPHFVYRTLRLQYFIYKHTDHRIGVHTEHDVEQFDWYTQDGDKPGCKWKEQFPWPSPGRDAHDTIDFTDPKAGRLIVNTRHGTVYLDVRSDGLNCFTFDSNEKRTDTMLIRKK